MKEFNLEEAKQGKPVCTREGNDARIICFDRKGKKYPIIALVKDNNQDNEEVRLYKNNGRFFANENEYEYDLFMKPEKHTGFVNLYKNEGKHRVDSYVYESKEEALASAINDCIGTSQIEWEE